MQARNALFAMKEPTMKLAPLLLLIAVASTTAHSQTFTNLNFEAASTTPSSSGIPFLLDWSTAAPGWSHSAGADSFVYYGLTHVGQTQWFLLTDAMTPPSGTLAGSHSFSYVSGFDSSNSSNPQWVNAYLSQTGMLPADARSLTLLATGPLGISVNGTALPLISMGGNAYAADISAFAGTTAELKFINTSAQFQNVLTIDNIAFSASPVPEPSTWLLLGLGLVGAGLISRRAGGRAG